MKGYIMIYLIGCRRSTYKTSSAGISSLKKAVKDVFFSSKYATTILICISPAESSNN